MKASAPGENHKLLSSFAGNWIFVNRMWMNPLAPPTESTGSASYRTPDQHVMEWYENRGGKETKTMEITYTRKK
jgi:hypothetical protein